MLEFVKISDTKYNVLFNNLVLGILLREIDGFYVFYQERHDAAWTAHILREISDKLNELNQAWDEYLRENLSNKSDPLQDDFDILNNL